jgi:DNA-binding NarL/FixJ family response regulator
LETARTSHDSYAQHICLALRIRFLLQQGRHSEALAVDVPTLSNSLPSGTAEAFASLALALASASRLRAAARVIDGVRGLSSAVEPTVLTAAVDAVVALKSGHPDAVQKAAQLVEEAFSTGAVDLLVTTYRSNPELLTLLLRQSVRRDDVARLLSSANDEDIARALGHDLAPDDPLSKLSPREREVFAHLEDGLSNAQIAAALFIAESTAKRHVHHVFEKLGYSDRKAIAFQAVLTRRSQATSAIEDTGDGPGS